MGRRSLLEQEVILAALFEGTPVRRTGLEAPHPGLDARIRCDLPEARGGLADEAHLDVRAGQLLAEQPGAGGERAVHVPEVVRDLAFDPGRERRAGFAE